jgi:hypothetical protein
MSDPMNGVLSPADLDANRAGRLTDQQRRGFGNLERGARKDRVAFAVICAGIAGLLAVSNGTGPKTEYRPLFIVAFAAGALVLLWAGLFQVDSLTRDLRAGSVASVEGAIGKDHRSSSSGSHSTTIHWLEMPGLRFEVGPDTYAAAPDAGYMRLFYLPRSHKVVNFEPLAERPAGIEPVIKLGTGIRSDMLYPIGEPPRPLHPEAAATIGSVPDPTTPTPESVAAAMAASPLRTFADLMGPMLSGDHDRRNEARAEFADLAGAFRAEIGAAATPPPANTLDPRPLAQAILGTWTMGPVKITFAPGGTASVTMPGGQVRSAHWSVEPDGRLRYDAMGPDQPADAWVANDTLTIAVDGRDIRLRRSA